MPASVLRAAGADEVLHLRQQRLQAKEAGSCARFGHDSATNCAAPRKSVLPCRMGTLYIVLIWTPTAFIAPRRSAK